jgi:hypothetical protein
MENSVQQTLLDAFNQLPSIVQRAILSSELEEKMRKLSEKHKIHLDKWTLLENEITFALFGITAPEDLAGNIESHVGIPREQAVAINNDAVEIIFEPIRKQLQETVAADKAKNPGQIVSIEQQKVLDEIGVKVPAGTAVQTSKTLSDILKRRSEGEKVGDAKTKNNAGDSEAARGKIEGDPYRELP